MRRSLTWQQICRFVVAVCLAAFIVAHSLVQQHSSSPTIPEAAKPRAASTLPELWPFLRSRPSIAPFETGMIFPRWGVTAYGNDDVNWVAGLRNIKSQTGARWITLTIPFHQASEFATQVISSTDTPTPASLAEGIRAAKQLGYRVFVIPMITVDSNQHWSGNIHFATSSQAQMWFDSYWQALQPYVFGAQHAGAEQFSLGNELEQLQTSPAALWQQLLDRVSRNFTGSIVYSVNWTSLRKSIPSWMRDGRISAIGISTYIPLTARAQRLDAKQLPALWHEKVSLALDSFAAQLGKPLLLSELGYRDTAFAGYNPWLIVVHEPQDDEEQAALFDAAFQNIASDLHIIGVFVWAWSFPSFAPNGKPAAQILYRWYGALS